MSLDNAAVFYPGDGSNWKIDVRLRPKWVYFKIYVRMITQAAFRTNIRLLVRQPDRWRELASVSYKLQTAVYVVRTTLSPAAAYKKQQQ